MRDGFVDIITNLFDEIESESRYETFSQAENEDQTNITNKFISIQEAIEKAKEKI